MYATSDLDRYRRLDGKPLEESIFQFRAPGRLLAVDPLSLVKVGAPQDDLKQLISAFGEVESPYFYHDLPTSPGRYLYVSEKGEPHDKATGVAVQRLEKVCWTAKDALIRDFGDFKDLCALYRGAAEGALISAESRGWKFEKTKGSRCDVTYQTEGRV
ncbi:hypothetical protein FOZ63_016359 [Perkinsus olseni]|uniref:Uncharacterized protein n=1 Tax=Perkinsus olseni TaxID=32597 RepID=A0A7J6SMS5_PEROL|nr:hypothetical protein FOZ60_016860 [Perkinsus olseni]KAF4713444.1 hypothetical protein FOZ62_016084 [Perkinsus olseni]KAF4734238.1 hypothetical protein FOZ63_016359 [Perkinsus olseni]